MSEMEHIENAESAVETNEALNNTATQPQERKTAEADPYAHMFADWDLVPPQLLIRRIRRNNP